MQSIGSHRRATRNPITIVITREASAVTMDFLTKTGLHAINPKVAPKTGPIRGDTSIEASTMTELSVIRPTADISEAVISMIQ